MSCVAVMKRTAAMEDDWETKKKTREKENLLIATKICEIEVCGATELNLNYLCLSCVPHGLTESELCRERVQKLYFKGNIITELVHIIV